MGLIATLVLGALAGWITGKLMGSAYGLVGDIILGIVGGIVGGFLAGLLGLGDMVSGFNLTSLIISVVGAVLVVAIARFLRKR